MNKFGIQYLGEDIKTPIKHSLNKQTELEQYSEIRKILKKFQQGYSERKLENVDSFAEEIFQNSDDLLVLGTSSGEMFLNYDEVKQLIKDDWESWGNLKIDCENADISIYDDNAWFSTNGTVEYSFEHTSERYDGDVDFIKSTVEDNKLTPKQRITFINWVLSLNYHQRDKQAREYFWPMGLSGMLVKEENTWKITHLHFSIAKSNFSDELIKKYFNDNDNAYIIGPEIKWHKGTQGIKEFFINSDMSSLHFEIENIITSKTDKVIWITALGILQHNFTEEELINRSLQELNNLFKSELLSPEILFAAHRSIAYVLKECGSGSNYTCPIRITASILNDENGLKFNHIHFSFPFYWIIEGKLGMSFDK